jgi:hypothetical protein
MVEFRDVLAARQSEAMYKRDKDRQALIDSRVGKKAGVTRASTIDKTVQNDMKNHLISKVHPIQLY